MATFPYTVAPTSGALQANLTRIARSLKDLAQKQLTRALPARTLPASRMSPLARAWGERQRSGDQIAGLSPRRLLAAAEASTKASSKAKVPPETTYPSATRTHGP